MTPQDQEFINTIIPGAQAAHKKYGVFASVSIAQGILESSWGRSGLATKAYNLFGIKADHSWLGASVLMPTTEYIHGIKTSIDAPFRKYSNVYQSIEDHALFLHNNPRYKPAFQCKTGVEFAYAIAKAGYATDPAYGRLLAALITQHNLQKFDL